MSVLPTFFVIGAAKAGTTSLHEYLAAHPEITMTSVKEPMCFVGPRWRERLSHYERLFAAPGVARGESSTAYTAFPFAPEVPERVHETVSDAKLIYVVRDPIPRALSHYAQNVWDEIAERPFEELMDDLEDPMNMPVWSSRYATQLERWSARFPLDQILVLDCDDLRHRRTETLRRIFAFLEVDADFGAADFAQEHNTARSHIVPTAVGRRLGARAQRLGRSALLQRLLVREVPAPVLSLAQQERLAALLAPEAARLREITGLELSHWGV